MKTLLRFSFGLKELSFEIMYLQSADIVGCKRRSTYPFNQDFKCEGTKGPPCFVQRGDTVLLDVVWNNPGVTNMTQSTVWVTWIEMPWVGMDTEGCPFLDGGKGCRANALVSNLSRIRIIVFYEYVLFVNVISILSLCEKKKKVKWL